MYHKSSNDGANIKSHRLELPVILAELLDLQSNGPCETLRIQMQQIQYAGLDSPGSLERQCFPEDSFRQIFYQDTLCIANHRLHSQITILQLSDTHLLLVWIAVSKCCQGYCNFLPGVGAPTEASESFFKGI